MHGIIFYGKIDKKMFSAKEEIFKSHKIIQQNLGEIALLVSLTTML